MKNLKIYLLLTLFLMGILLLPVFVFASEVCYVDKDADSGGNGTSDDPFNKISKATEDDCDEIRVTKGTYSEDVSLGKSVSLKGENRNDVNIEGKIIMKDNSKISELTITGGVVISDGADAFIEDVKIKGANEGISTVGGGKLTVNKTILTGNRKGAYIQKGKTIKITNSEVVDNKEEGLDIRANVSGTINNNDINNNGESGIEVILGRSELNIINNKFKKNGASGIAAQFYEESSKLGNVTIKNNIIIENSNYGIDCKAPSGSDGRPKGYWSDSMDLSSNKVLDNKKKDFSSACKFNEDKISDATKTKEQREAEKAVLLEKEKKQALSALEKVELEELEAQQKEEERIAQIDREEKAVSDVAFNEAEELFKSEEELKNEVEKRNRVWAFLVGEDYKKLKLMKDSLVSYDEKIDIMESRKENISDENILNEIDSQVLVLREKRDNLVNFIEIQKENFSLFGWILKGKYLED